MRSAVSAETRTSPPLRTLLAVWKLTPARAATSLIETYFRRAIHSRPRGTAPRVGARPAAPGDAHWTNVRSHRRSGVKQRQGVVAGLLDRLPSHRFAAVLEPGTGR